MRKLADVINDHRGYHGGGGYLRDMHPRNAEKGDEPELRDYISLAEYISDQLTTKETKC